MKYEITYTDTFADWLRSLKDIRAKQRIKVRLDRILEGNFGDFKTVNDGVSELRVDVGKGYRVYYTIRKRTVVILLCGSDKPSQKRAIKQAKSMLNDLEV